MIYRCITILFCLAFFLFENADSIGQETSIRISISYPEDTPNEAWISGLNGKTFNDSTDLIQALNSLRDKYYKLGYLSAGFDSLESSGNYYSASFSSGIKYEWGEINLPDSYPPEISRIPRKIKIKSGRPLRIEEDEYIREELLKVYENNGYPFASVTYDSVNIVDGVFIADIKVESGPLVIIDSIINRSDNIVSNKVLQQILGLVPGQIYSEDRIVEAGNTLDNSRIIQVVNPLEVGFNDDKAWIYLGARKKSSNSFDGIVGLVPGAANSNAFALTGSLDLVLNNTLKQAESFSLRWKAPGNQDQRLKVGFDIPYLMGWPLGITSSMEIFRKDSSYLNTNWKLGILADIRKNNRVGFYYKRKNSNVLLKENSGIYSDVYINLYGVNWNVDNIRNPINPSRGFFINSNIGVGKKNATDFESNDQSVVYWEGIVKSDFFVPLAKTWVLNFGAAGGYLRGGQIKDNEKFKLGGIHSLRGFEEESILADGYLLGTIELRYLFSRNSNVHLFLDSGYLWYPELSSSDLISPMGFGIGVSLETRAGILLLDYALGTSKDHPVNIRFGKIHLGIKSLF